MPNPLPTVIATAAPPTPQLVGYWDDWQQTSWSQVPQGVTTLIIAFDFVSGHTVVSDGNSPGYVTAAAIAGLHQRGIKVLLSLGGGSPATAFVFDGDTVDFETNLIAVLQQYGYDGVDFDDESGTQSTRVAALQTLIPATRAALNARGLGSDLVTLAAFDTPTSFGDDTLLAAPGVAGALSWINVMSYDYTAAESDLGLFVALYPAPQLMLGSDIAGDVPLAPDATLESLSGWVKTNGYGGMMLWTLNAATPSQMQAITTGLTTGK
ncbi:MAG TPA: glycoside hydrolase family 18 protein [Candidatus Baltobacteraceae bacterium]|nr:glycoside hydrolase family 18 protein [Candidatus Baltobacteraceae bacterium]